jgi:hypothetical protein
MVEIKCEPCHTWNTYADYCKNCNAVISMEEEARIETEIQAEIEGSNQIPSLICLLKSGKNTLIFF